MDDNNDLFEAYFFFIYKDYQSLNIGLQSHFKVVHLEQPSQPLGKTFMV